MSKENILFSIIGVLLGFIGGFMFANGVNERDARNTARLATATTASSVSAPVAGGAIAGNAATAPGAHPALPPNTVADQSTGGGGALPDVQQALELARKEPDNYEAQLKAAELFFLINRHAGAVEFLERAHKLRPDTYEVLVNLANANYQAGKFDIAEQLYTEALAKNADDVKVRARLGSTFLHRQPPQVDRAIPYLRQAIERDPRNEEALQELAFALSQKGDADETAALIARLEQVNPQNEAIPQLRAALTQLRVPQRSATSNQ